MAQSSGIREHHWSRLDSDNLTSLQELTEKALLSATKHRYSCNQIYTDVGDILVAVNPFQDLPLYGEEWSKAYSRPDVSELAPHIYRVAARAFNAMVQGKKDQVCVISGESGAGKTESAKFIMYQVMKMCRSAGLGCELQEQITQLNPILEAFGNARTALNDNSSRFGKFIQLHFDPSGRIVGAGLEQYLLEKSRVCVQGEMERNFHMFYYMFAGLPKEKLEQLQLKCPTEHRYLRNYPDVLQDCSSRSSKAAFESVVGSMLSVGFSEDEIVSVVALLAGVILIGDIEFRGVEDGEDNARVKNRQVAKAAAQVLELESAGELCFALTTLRTETRGEKVDKKYTCTKAADTRDALAKALYARMFQWIVSRLNAHLQPYTTAAHLNIGILDIFGFENFEHNSFEQFCINLANEQLQCYFNHQIFAMEKMELEKEGLSGLEITFTDNKPVLDLYLTRPIGLLSLLDEQCRGFNGTERAFVLRCKESFSRHTNYLPHKGNAPEFTIKHYAGDVKYVAEGFLEKNKDTLPDTLVDAVKTSSKRLVRTLFRRASEGSMLRKSTLRKSQRSVMRAMSRRKSIAKSKGGQKKLLTVSAHFRQSLDLLMERVFSASPHFVRCIKPNHEKRPLMCDDEFILKQLCYTGMLEAVRVRREGYAYRPYFSDFFNSYRGIAYHYTDPRVKGTTVVCSEILKKAGLSGWRMGQSRVFLRYYHEEKLQLLLKKLDDKALILQRVYRGHLARKWTARVREMQRNEKIHLTNFLTQINKHGKDHLPRIIEMNREDILSVRERFTRKPADASASSAAPKSYQGQATTTVKDRKLKMARNLGVKLVPSFASPVLPKLSKRSENQESSSNPGSPNHQATTNKKDGSRYGNKQKATVTPQASIQHEQIKRMESSPSRSHKGPVISSPVAAQRQLGNTQHTSGVAAAHGKGEIEGGSGSHELKSSGGGVTENHTLLPPKSAPPGKTKFNSRHKKVSADYEAAVLETSTTTKPEKSGSRFKLKLPFGNKVKEAKTKIENVDKDKNQKRPTPKPRKGQKQHWSPPREPAPPPPSEPAPPPPTDTQTSSPYHQGSNNSKYKHMHDERPPSPKMPPPGPATYPQLQPYTAIGTLSQTHSPTSSLVLTGNAVEEYLIPVKSQPLLDSPDDEDRPPSPKMPPPGPAVTYPKLQPLSSNGHTPATQNSTHRLAASGLSKSLDTVFDEYIGMTPTNFSTKPSPRKHSPSKPSPAKPPRPAEFTSSLIIEDDRPPSPKMPPPGPAMTYPNIPPSSTPARSITKSTAAATVSSTSMSLFDEYVGGAPSPTKSSQPPLGSRETKRPPYPKLRPPGGPITHPQVQALSTSHATSQSSRLSAAFDAKPAAGATSMSLDSILEQFSMMSGSQIGVSMF